MVFENKMLLTANPYLMVPDLKPLWIKSVL